MNRILALFLLIVSFAVNAQSINTISADRFIGGTFNGTGITGSGNLIISSPGPNVIGGSTNTDIGLFLTGTLTGSANVHALLIDGTKTAPTGDAYGIKLPTTLTLIPGVNGSAFGTYISPTINKAASGTHVDFTSLLVAQPTIVAGAATLNNSTSLKVSGAPTVGTNQRALWIVGATEIDGTVANSYSTTIIANNTSGQSYGMLIKGGTNSSDAAFSVSDSSSASLFQVTGAGSILMPKLSTSSAGTTGTMCWTTGTGNVNVDTTTTCLLSSAKYKQDEKPLNAGLRQVLALRPVSYNLRDQFNPAHLGEQIGFFAEDVAKVDSRLVSLEDDGSPHAVRYQQLTAVLTKAIQEQQAEIRALNHRLATLEKHAYNVRYQPASFTRH